jgi:hypothetical protein
MIKMFNEEDLEPISNIVLAIICLPLFAIVAIIGSVLYILYIIWYLIKTIFKKEENNNERCDV